MIGSIALTFFAFLGFGVVSFTAKDLKNEGDLGPATYIALAIATATYVAISLGVFGQLTPEEVVAAGPTAIAEAAKPVLGQAGYIIVAITAMLSTAGAVNSTIYPTPKLLRSLARDQLFPPFFGTSWGPFPVGLLVTGLLIAVLVWLFDLTAIASLGSAVALLIFLVITLGHFGIRERTGASAAMLLIAMLTVVVTLLGFFVTTLETSPTSLVAFVILFLIAVVVDSVWRRARSRRGAIAAAE